MGFDLNPNVSVQTSSDGFIRHLEHIDHPYRIEDTPAALESELSAESVEPIRPQQLAEHYLHDVLPHYRLEDDMLSELGASPTESLTEAGQQLRFEEEKSLMGNVSVAYRQTCFGIPVWSAGFSVALEDAGGLAVTGSTSSLQRDLDVNRPASDAAFFPERIEDAGLAGLLGIPENADQIRIQSRKLFIYRYRAEMRALIQEGPDESAAEEETPAADFSLPLPTLPFPDVADTIEDGKDYVVAEILFTQSDPGVEPLNWTALIEVETGSVLYLRALLGCVNGDAAHGAVYLVDPVTKTGDPNNSTAAAAGVLDSFRDDVPIHGLEPASPGAEQALSGEYVKIENFVAPDISPPTSPPPGDFSYSVPTNDFGAINAYHNCDRLFRLLEGFGIDVGQYFDGTSFPVRVDHRVQYRVDGTLTGNIVNASAPGNSQRTGSDGFRFALARRDTSLGISADWRVVLHEFGHALLWDNVGSPNFGFAHSAGDSLAAILNDPDAHQGHDRGLTFPWVTIGRRNDRLPADGWAWRGPNYGPFNPLIDRAGYRAEQILSSTMFRIYRAAGGDSEDVAEKRFAAHYTAFLIVKAIGLLTAATNPADPETFAAFLRQVDSGGFRFEGDEYPCGVLRKVIRWGFEKQGAYPSSTASRPITTEGDPPAVDLFIDDGRSGEYQFQNEFNQADGIWTRHAADSGIEPQAPVPGQVNFVYVRIENRGTADATSNLEVVAFSSPQPDPAAQRWPVDWEPLPRATSFSEPSSVASGSGEIAGPFEWTPGANGESVLAIVSSDGDSSLAARFTDANPIPNRRLVPEDNNIAQKTFPQ